MAIAAPIAEIDTSHAAILIVDDHLDNVSLLSLLLSDLGYSVREATSGEMALKEVQAANPELILLDVRMPNLNGYEVCKRIKENPKTCSIPIIFLSALNDPDEKVHAFAVGGADYVTKPFQAEEVLMRVRHQIMIVRQQQQLLHQRQQLALQNRQLHQEIRQRRQVEAQLKQANLELQRIANTDSLTQVANRRCFDETLERECRRLRREKQPLSLLLCDIDYFKNYNDLYGHPAGDACLYRVAQVISNCVKRPADVVARYGGEEFAIILPNTAREGAVAIAKAIQAAMQSSEIPHIGSPVANHITLSIGIACSKPMLSCSCQELIAAADTALYQAKETGRNRWVVFTNNELAT